MTMKRRLVASHYILTCILIAVFMSLVALPDIIPTHRILTHFGVSTTLFAISVWRIADYLIWIPLLPAIIFLSRRFRFRRSAFMKSLSVHLAACLLLGAVKFIVLWITLPHFISDEFIDLMAKSEEWTDIVEGLLIDVSMYWILLAACNGFAYFRNHLEREIRMNRLESQLVEARLSMLKMQLNPHFLFNTLNTIAGLVHDSPEDAEEMISRLGELLRLSLESQSSHEVSLQHELDVLSRYLAIEQIRFGDRLEFEMEIDPETMSARIPNLILQPIVENAVTHGICREASRGRIILRTSRRNGVLRIEIKDTGPGLPGGRIPGKSGLGITNTLSRLEMLYGKAGRLELLSPEEGGCLARLSIPFHTETEQKGENRGNRHE